LCAALTVYLTTASQNSFWYAQLFFRCKRNIAFSAALEMERVIDDEGSKGIRKLRFRDGFLREVKRISSAFAQHSLGGAFLAKSISVSIMMSPELIINMHPQLQKPTALLPANNKSALI
jgi:hypothetical protein